MTISRPAGFRGAFRTDPGARSAYSEGAGPFRIVPAAVAIPADREDLAVLIRAAADGGYALTPRGAGSGMPGGNVGTGVVVDLRTFDRPASVSLAMTANVGAAVTWGTLDSIAAHFGFRLPPDPSSGAFCTVGGMVSTNASGARSFRAGSIRAWVRGVEIVTADGETGWFGRRAAKRQRTSQPGRHRYIVDPLTVQERLAPVEAEIRAARGAIECRFPATRKNSSGYALDHYLDSGDLVDLIIGSEGTLAFVTRAELQLERRPEAVGTVLLGLTSLAELGDVVQAIAACEPSALELLDKSFLERAQGSTDLPLDQAAGVLIVEVERANKKDAKEAVAAVERATKDAAVFTRSGLSESERDNLWKIRHGASPSLSASGGGRRSLQVIEDGCVPVPMLGRYLNGVHAAARDVDIPVVAFGHAGDGHLHVNALVDPRSPNLDDRLTQLYESVTALVVELGGTTSGEHGDGRLRAPAVERVFGPEIVALFRKVKAAFDPSGVMNPGVLLPVNGARPISHLKVGPDAAPLSDHIAERLTELERSGGWRTPPLTLVDEAS